jgi:nicotinamidase-related amidase
MSAPLAGIGADAVHVVVDMQRLFAEETGWRVPSLGKIVPNIRRLIEHRSARALYTRFITPHGADAARGVWQVYYRRWTQVTRAKISDDLFDLVKPLAELAPAAAQVDKESFSALSSPEFAAALARLEAGPLVLSGVETDVCVLATALEAVERGHRVVIAADAVTSSSLPAHRATLDLILPRFEHMIDIAPTSAIVTAWG